MVKERAEDYSLVTRMASVVDGMQHLFPNTRSVWQMTLFLPGLKRREDAGNPDACARWRRRVVRCVDEGLAQAAIVK